MNAKVHGGVSGMMEVYCVLIGGIVTRLCTFVKTHLTVYLQGVHYIEYKLYFNKFMFRI